MKLLKLLELIVSYVLENPTSEVESQRIQQCALFATESIPRLI